MIGSAVSSLGSHDHSFLSLVYLCQGLLAWQISAGSQDVRVKVNNRTAAVYDRGRSVLSSQISNFRRVDDNNLTGQPQHSAYIDLGYLAMCTLKRAPLLLNTLRSCAPSDLRGFSRAQKPYGDAHFPVAFCVRMRIRSRYSSDWVTFHARRDSGLQKWLLHSGGWSPAGLGPAG